jgi:hypothetical protein
MNKITDSMRLYTILFWAYPKSGFDIIKKNDILKLFREIAGEALSGDPDLINKLLQFESEHEGLVLYNETIESNTEIVDPEIEVMPTIQKAYPEANYIIMLPLTVPDKNNLIF